MFKLSEVRKGMVKVNMPATEVVTEVKEGGATALPTDGVTVIKNVYLNNKLSVEEVVSILESIDIPSYSMGVYRDFFGGVTIWKNGNTNPASYMLYTGSSNAIKVLFASGSDPDAGAAHTYVNVEEANLPYLGWNPNCTDEDFIIPFESTLPTNKEATAAAVQQLFSATPFEDYTVTTEVSKWSELESDKAPYGYYTTVKLEDVPTVHNVTYELINDNPVLFSKYGFAIADVTYETRKVIFDKHHWANKHDAILTIYAVNQPTEEVELVIAVEV